MGTPRDSGPAGPSEPALTPEAAQAKINEMKSNPEDLYHAHPSKLGRPERVAEVTRLFQIAYPEPSPGEEPSSTTPPEKAEAVVELPLPPMPEGQAWDPHGLKAFEELANELDLPRETAVKVLALEAECCRQEPPSSEETLALLREEWGQAFDEKLAAARWLVQNLVPLALQGALERSRLGDHPAMIRLAAAEGERRLAMLRQDGQLVAEIGRHGQGSPGYEAAVAKRDAVYKQVYGRRGA